LPLRGRRLRSVRFDLQVEDDFECGNDFCMGFVANGQSGGKALNPGIDFRIHWIDEGDSPIVIITGGGLAGTQFIDRAEAVLATLAFGDPQPHRSTPSAPNGNRVCPVMSRPDERTSPSPGCRSSCRTNASYVRAMAS
jgi:hypothetical protein